MIKRWQKKNIYTEKELFSMTKEKQIYLIISFGEENIPRLEKGRVELIIKLQK